MTDTVAVAIITGGITGLVAVAGNVVTYVATDRALRSETRQRTEQRVEAERKQRLEAYHNFLTALTRYDFMMTGYLPSGDEDFANWLREYDFHLNGLYLFGHADVVDAVAPVTNLLHELSDVYNRPVDETVLDRHRRHYLDRRKEFADATNHATRAMRIDIGQDLGMPADLVELGHQ
jgi:hypothetical protein